MTVPAPQSSSSASAQQASSSPSASGQTPTFAHDTVTQGTSVTGLSGVFAERDAADVAGKIVKAVEDYLQRQHQHNIQEIRVIGDLSALSDITTLRILTGQVTQIQNQITAYREAVHGLKQPPEVREGKSLVAADALSGVAGLFGVITQLVAGTYTYSGQSIPNASVGGLDILIAKQLDSDALRVRVDRFAASLPAQSNILTQIQALLSQVAKDLNPAITQAASVAEKWAQIVTNGKDQLTELADEKKTVLEKNPSQDLDKPPYSQLQDTYKSVSGHLPDESGEAAEAQNLVTAGQALATAINAFVTAAVSAPAAGGLPPVAHAARGEVFSKPRTALLYAQVIAAGDDQILRQDLIHNTWTNLTGLTAEYALIKPWADNDAVASDLVSFYAARHGSMRKGLKNVIREPRPSLE